VADAVTGIQTASTNIKWGRGNLAPWQMLGLSPHGNPFDVLDALRRRIRDFGPEHARVLAADAGIGAGMLYFLQQSNLEIGKINEKYKLTDTQRARMVGLNRAWNEFKTILSLTSRQFVVIMSKLTTNLLNIAREIVEWLGRMVEKIRDSSVENRRLLLVIGAIGAAIAAAMLPFTRFAIVLAVLALLVEDFWGAWNGKKSLIGEIFKKFGGDFDDFKKWIQDAIAAIGGLWEKIIATGLVEQAIRKLTETFRLLFDAVAMTLGMVNDFASGKGGWMDRLERFFSNAYRGEYGGNIQAASVFGGELGQLFNKIKGDITGDYFAYNYANRLMSDLSRPAGRLPDIPAGPRAAGNVTVNASVTQNISGADASEAAAAARYGLGGFLQGQFEAAERAGRMLPAPVR
jgi:hypothetical protein